MAKVALLIGVSEYESELRSLSAPVKDVEAMQRVLQDVELGGFKVTALQNPDRQTMEEAIDTLFSERARDDIVLLFFSGHGIKDDSGNLYFATRTTRPSKLMSTAVHASFVHRIMDKCPSRRQVVILDCCFSGAFAEGLLAKDDGSVDIKKQLGGEGRAVLTSSTSTQRSFENQGFDLSIYTHFLVEGLRTGVADRDNDGAVSVDELHEYACEKVQETAPAKMKPEIYPIKGGGKILLAKVKIDDPRLRYRREVERFANRGEISFTNRITLEELRDSLKLSSNETSEIEEEVLKPHKEYKRKLHRYEQALDKEIERKYPLGSDARNDLKRLQQVLGLLDKDVTRIEEGITSQKEFVQSPEQVIGATRDAVKQPQKIGKNSTPSPESRDDKLNPPKPEDPPSKYQPKPNDQRKRFVTIGGGGIVLALALVVSGMSYLNRNSQPKVPPCSPTEDLCKIFPQVSNGQVKIWSYPQDKNSNPKYKRLTDNYVSNDRDCGGSSSPVLKLQYEFPDKEQKHSSGWTVSWDDGFDVSKFSNLDLRIKSASGSGNFGVGMRDINGKKTRQDYQKNAGSDWEPKKIPLSEIGDNLDKSKIKEIYIALYSENGSGTICIDKIQLR